MNSNQRAFIELVRVGLWEVSNDNHNQNADSFKAVDWQKVFLLAQEQSVQGIVLQGLEWFIEHGIINKAHVPQNLLLQWIGEVQMIEQQNKAMNAFVAKLIMDLRQNGVKALLVKGQGIAQCYNRPLWREAGDIDLFVSNKDYEKAKEYLCTLGVRTSKDESETRKHIDFVIESFSVELHGTLRGRLLSRIDDEIDHLQDLCFNEENTRVWNIGGFEILLPAPDEDIVFVFTHILQHFFWEGIGLRQICDWCRLLWTYRDTIDKSTLLLRLHQMRLLSEWIVFGALAVNYLGMPSESMLLYDDKLKWSKKADILFGLIMCSGNFGNTRSRLANETQPFLIHKLYALVDHCMDFLQRVRIFPLDSIVIFIRGIYYRLVAALKGRNIL